MDEIKVGKIEVLNVNARDEELMKESVGGIISSILETNPDVDVLYLVEVDVREGEDANAVLQNMKRVRDLFVERGILNAIYVPKDTVRVSEVKVVHEYPKENK